MQLVQIADLINTIKMPNSLGESTTIADDLSNIDEGIDLSNVTDDDIKDYAGKFCVGVINIFRNEEEYAEESFGLYHDEIEYGGLLQVVRNRGRMTAYTTPILSLESVVDDPTAPDYNDSHYYGSSQSVKVFTKDVADELRYSIPNSLFKQSFTSANDVMKLVALIEQNYRNTMASMLKELARSILIAIINECYDDSRVVHILTEFNTINGYTSGDDGYVTIDNYRQNMQFRLFAQEVFQGLQDGMLDYNEKYNDGTVEIFAKKEDLRTLVLSDFARQMEFTQGLVYNPDKTSAGEFTKINFWQNASTDLFPTISDSSVHDQVVIDGGESDDTTINHIIGLCFSKYKAGICNKMVRSRSKYVPEGDFSTVFTAILKKYWIDSRDQAVIITLD